MKILVVINPRAGGGRGATMGRKVRTHLKNSSDHITFIEAVSLQESLAQLDALWSTERYDILIGVGGDGLVHDLLSRLIVHQTPLLIVPSGTGNDLARTLGLHGHKLESILSLPHRSQPVALDVANISHGNNTTPFVQIMSTGFDSVVNEHANGFKVIRGKNKYVVAVLQKVWRFKAIEYSIKIDDELIERRAMLVCVANGVSYGGGMKIVPHANPHDELLDIMIVDHVNPFRLLMVFPRVFFGSHVNHPRVKFYTCKRVEISGATVAFADGERVAQLPISIELSNAKLQVFKV